MEVVFEDDISMVISAIQNGDTEDAIKLLLEIKEESEKVIKPINLN